MHNQIGECGAVRHWRMSGLTFTPHLRSIPRLPVVIHPVRVAKDEGVVAVKSHEDAGQALSRRGEWPS